MKILITTLILGASFPVNAHESIGDHIHREAYQSQKGYAYENKCFRFEYREKYICYLSLVIPIGLKTLFEKSNQ